MVARTTEMYVYRSVDWTIRHIADTSKVGWIQAAFLMIKSQVGIGVLSIPKALAILGLLPGIVTLLAVAIITTWVSAFPIQHVVVPH